MAGKNSQDSPRAVSSILTYATEHSPGLSITIRGPSVFVTSATRADRSTRLGFFALTGNATLIASRPAARKFTVGSTNPEVLVLESWRDKRPLVKIYFKDKKDGKVSVEFLSDLCGHKLPMPVGSVRTRVSQHNVGVKESSDMCRSCFEHPSERAKDLVQRLAQNGDGNGDGNGNEQMTEAKDGRGGAHNVKWTPEREEEYLTCYEEVLPKIKKKDSNIPAEVLAKLLLPRVQPSDVAREYAAQLLEVESNEYLGTIITRARKRRRGSNTR